MARITDEGISGVIGNIVFYTMNGKRYARSLPTVTKKRKKELAQSSQAKVFGTVSSHGTAMLRHLQASLLFPFTLTTYNQCRGWMRTQYAPNREETKWLLSSQHNNTCQLNMHADLRDFLKAGIQVSDDGKGQIKIRLDEINPVKQIRAPKDTQAVNMKLVVLSAPFGNGGVVVQSSMEQYSIRYANALLPARETILEIKGKKGDIVVVVAGLEFEMNNGPFAGFNTDTKYLPAAIVAMGKLRE